MGRKAVRSKIAPALRREVLQLAEQLLQKCTVPPNSVKEEWEQFVSIYELVQQIRLKEQAYGFVPPDRDARGFATFMKWAKSKGIKADKVDTAKFGIGGFGLRASAEIQEEELFLSVPKDAMMTIETANKSSLGWLIEIDPLLQNMPYVTLALHLLCEKFSSSSAWTSYINILPGTFTVPLYFTLEEFQMLKGDPAYDEALKQYRHIARQYAYFYKLFHTATDVKGILFLKENFSYDAYRWAVSVVMTRQNMIPSADTSGLIAALIPMWDMCNHINGKISTDFNPERNCSECYALQHFKKGEQVFIFYGARTNTLFLIHSGFVCKNNLYDTVPVKLGISKSDPLFYEKCILLTRLEISVQGLFHVESGEEPIPPKLLAFLRVFSMDADTLQLWLDCENLALLKEAGALHDVEVFRKAWTFIETRLALILRQYPTTLQEDKAKLKDKSLSEHAHLALQLTIGHKEILRNAQAYALAQRNLSHGKEKVGESAASASDKETPTAGEGKEAVSVDSTEKADAETGTPPEADGEREAFASPPKLKEQCPHDSSPSERSSEEEATTTAPSEEKTEERETDDDVSPITKELEQSRLHGDAVHDSNERK